MKYEQRSAWQVSPLRGGGRGGKGLSGRAHPSNARLAHVQEAVEDALECRDEVELLQAEEVGHGRDVVGEHVFPEADDAPDVPSPSRASLREVELLHDLRKGTGQPGGQRGARPSA